MLTRAANALIAAADRSAVTTGLSDDPATVAALTSAPASSNPRSDGLIGAASTRISTWFGSGGGVCTWTIESSSLASGVTNERNSSPVSGLATVIQEPPCKRSTQQGEATTPD